MIRILFILILISGIVCAQNYGTSAKLNKKVGESFDSDSLGGFGANYYVDTLTDQNIEGKKTFNDSIVADTIRLNGILFNISNMPTYSRGQLYYDDEEDALTYDANGNSRNSIGYEVWVNARNNSGATLHDSTIVYITGAIGKRPTIAKADATNFSKSKILGVVTQDINNNNNGKVTVLGCVNDINTSRFAEGTELFLDPANPGGYTSVHPTGTNISVSIGYVTYQHAVNGKLHVHPDRAHRLQDLADVNDGTPTNGNFLKGNGTHWTTSAIAISNVTGLQDSIDRHTDTLQSHNTRINTNVTNIASKINSSLLSTDTSLAGNSNDSLVSQKAIKNYIDNKGYNVLHIDTTLNGTYNSFDPANSWNNYDLVIIYISTSGNVTINGLISPNKTDGTGVNVVFYDDGANTVILGKESGSAGDASYRFALSTAANFQFARYDGFEFFYSNSRWRQKASTW